MGYKGVSFPLQLSKKGGILLSDTTRESPTHLAQALEQLLGTHRFERVMEVEHHSSLEQTVFEKNLSAATMIKALIVDTVANLEPRVSVSEEDIDVVFKDESAVAYVTFTVNDLGIEETIPVSIGGISNIG